MDNSTNNMSGKLIQYLDGDLPQVEKAELERQLLSDISLKEEFENLKLSREAVRMYGLHQHISGIHEQMMKEMQEMQKAKARPAIRTLRYVLGTAAAILIIVLGIALFKTASPSANKLFAEIYRPYELSTSRSVNDESAIDAAYKAGEFNEVARRTDTSISLHNIFLSAMSYLELKQDKIAIEKFKSIIDKNESAGTSMLKDEAQFYLALAYLRAGNYNNAAELMTSIHDDPNHLYREKITDKLLRDVERLKN